ncbi:hypothetical protein J2Y03_003990 [Neobacillus niacini]|uniref:hypothetical protein n=1 Tax=Neobacillus niacini TaxID=86668 RepID=UPI0028649496|nr:hypothetical protein [Neobacillus niacini]MDR7078933.1 hypothetical protein [Neobacillus niacini]
MSVLDRSPFLYLFCIIAGFALLRVPLTGFFAPLSPLVVLIGILAILLFSLVLIIQGLLSLAGKRR